MLLPSGAHRGTLVAEEPSEVNCTAFEPSLSHFQISLMPERYDTNAMFLPSGEYRGLWSCREEEINSIAPPPVVGRSARQMLAPPS